MFWVLKKKRLTETVLLNTHNMFWSRNKKIKFSLHTLSCVYATLCCCLSTLCIHVLSDEPADLGPFVHKQILFTMQDI